MEIIISFLEGIITFISPCLLPMLPLYIVYFAAGVNKNKRRRTLMNAIGFVIGFTILFIILGVFAATAGNILNKYKIIVNIITGGIVIIFGLNFIGVFTLKFLNNTHKLKNNIKPLGFFSSVLFGVIFSIGWTPCVGTFLGSALMLASQQGSIAEGVFMLLAYSLGLGIPFIISAVLIDKLESAFDFIKKHYKTINIICGLLLIIVGILMMTGHIEKMLEILSF